MVGTSDGSPVVNATTDEEEPGVAPENVTGQSNSSTSILVMWDKVPSDQQNGIITGYTITYHSQTENDKGNVLAGPDDRQKELANLKEWVNYNITVFASTVKGAGPASDPVIVVRTDQDKPAAAPVDVRGHKSSSTSIFVQWNEVPAADQNGVILTYTITYQSLTTKHNGSVTVNYPELQKNVTHLQDYTNYSIRVYASTEKGNGPSSDPIVVVTDQEEQPTITVQPQAHEKTEGDTVTLSCKADGNPVPTISWTVNGSPISVRDNSRISFSENKQQLTVRNVERTDSGVYRCVASNKFGNATSDAASLDIQFAPEISKRPKDTRAVEGQDVVFHCLVEGNPKPSVGWTKNEEELNLAANPRLSSAIIDDTHNLTITDVHLPDAGQYRCLANNSVGQTTSSAATLIVEEYCKY
ncbi:Down syndrome cell adhesion molecule-like isoform X2 [Orbicella faveolata]|uniref:Down syndrome cell adhesion molecule-like isoform X2 n=1 Tax=Orbicella faveolata TaxID=48498 RepID=UPI0009E55994|nr:Down syndrome cell adhesion molecule-like isoform X2 [Orbicella faveolata]